MERVFKFKVKLEAPTNFKVRSRSKWYYSRITMLSNVNSFLTFRKLTAHKDYEELI